jgi:hypothetical protein
MDIREAYATLGVDPAEGATPEAIRKAYRSLVLRSHPDTVQGEHRKRIAHERTLRLNDAYQTLKASPPCEVQHVVTGDIFGALLHDLGRTGVFHASAVCLERLILASMEIALGNLASPMTTSRRRRRR